MVQADERGLLSVLPSGAVPPNPNELLQSRALERLLSRLEERYDRVVIDAPPANPGEEWMMVAARTMTAFSGPWGMSFTANLTPDDETGLGRWTLENFKDTIRTGRHMGRGRPILPTMPVPMYKNFNDADFAAIYAFLRSIPPVKNRVPEPLPPANEEN